MATSVNNAFDEFLRDSVRLDSERNKIAKSSKQWLISVIKEFPVNGNFPAFHPDLVIEYGSYSRKTKIRPLDDIDLMFILHAQGARYLHFEDGIRIYNSSAHSLFKDFQFDDSTEISSIKVVNKFKEFLQNVPQYNNAEIKRNQEAVVLELQSYEWAYDIVPCFLTTDDIYGRNYYLIPDGKGHWKKTDPRIDKANLLSCQQLHEVSIIDVIRLTKYWNCRATMPTIKSYMLESMVLSHLDGKRNAKWVDVEMQSILQYIAAAILNPVPDPKGIQGDLNDLSWEDQQKIRQRALSDYQLALDARRYEEVGLMKESVTKWRELFGEKFPSYSKPVTV